MSRKVVHLVEDDMALREALGAFLEDAGYEVRMYCGAEEFLDDSRPDRSECVISDVRLQGSDGLTLLSALRQRYGGAHPLVLITGHCDVSMAIAAMKAGAADILEKPFEPEALLSTVEAAIEKHADAALGRAAATAAGETLQRLTPSEAEVCAALVTGLSAKEIAGKLDLSPRCVELHRARIMEKTGARNIIELVRLWITTREAQEAGAEAG
ncbi:MAG: response regulator transcription factor [Pseudomonadota bacterium]